MVPENSADRSAGRSWGVQCPSASEQPPNAEMERRPPADNPAPRARLICQRIRRSGLALEPKGEALVEGGVAVFCWRSASCPFALKCPLLLASNCTSCRSALANQVRLVLHTAAYWLMQTARDAIPKPQPLAAAEFTTLRLRLLKIAGRITEAATRVRIALAGTCPEAELFLGVARSLLLAGP